MKKHTVCTIFTIFAFCLFFVSGCNGRNVGTEQDAGTDAQVSERVIEYTVRYPETGYIEIGSQNIQLVEVTMKNLHPSETAMVSGLFFQMRQTPWWNIQNLQLLQGGAVSEHVLFTNDSGSLNMLVDFISEPAIAPGQSATLYLRGDVWEGVCTYVGPRFLQVEADILGGTTDMPFELRASSMNQEVVERLVVGDWLYLVNPAEQVPDGYVPAGSANVPVLKFVLQSGTPSTVEGFQIEVSYHPDMKDYISNLRLLNEDGIVISTGAFEQGDCPEPGRCFARFDDAFDLETCAGDIFTIALTLEQNALSGTLRVNLFGITFDAVNRSSQDPLHIPSYNIIGSFLQVMSF